MNPTANSPNEPSLETKQELTSKSRNAEGKRINSMLLMSQNGVEKKAMFTVSMDYNGVEHHEFLQESRTVNKK